MNKITDRWMSRANLEQNTMIFINKEKTKDPCSMAISMLAKERFKEIFDYLPSVLSRPNRIAYGLCAVKEVLPVYRKAHPFNQDPFFTLQQIINVMKKDSISSRQLLLDLNKNTLGVDTICFRSPDQTEINKITYAIFELAMSVCSDRTGSIHHVTSCICSTLSSTKNIKHKRLRIKIAQNGIEFLTRRFSWNKEL